MEESAKNAQKNPAQVSRNDTSNISRCAWRPYWRLSERSPLAIMLAVTSCVSVSV